MIHKIVTSLNLVDHFQKPDQRETKVEVNLNRYTSDGTLLSTLNQLIEGKLVAMDVSATIRPDSICDAFCDTIACDSICDGICDGICDAICDAICDTICDKICDEVCDKVSDKSAIA